MSSSDEVQGRAMEVSPIVRSARLPCYAGSLSGALEILPYVVHRGLNLVERGTPA